LSSSATSTAIAALDKALAQSEVEHLHDAVGRDLHVRRFQVAVNDSLLVRRVERGGDLLRDLQRLDDRAAACAGTGEPFGQRVALDNSRTGARISTDASTP
jgi:hypothetical protein